MTETLEAKVAELAAKVHRLEEERAVLQTLHRYGHSIDYGLEEAWVDCFTEDGAFDLHVQQEGEARRRERDFGTPHSTGIRFSGRDVLRKFISAHTRAPMAWHKHLLVEPVISIAADGEHATVQSYFARLDEDGSTRFISAFGRYLDDMVRCPDGRWRFRERIAEIESVR